MKFNKKAALNLSMQTIVVIVIGVTILSLGLMWVRNTFSNIEELTVESFENAERVLGGEEDFTGMLSISRSISLKKGQSKVVVLRVKNIGDNAGSFSLTNSPAGGNSEVQNCLSSLNFDIGGSTIQPGDIKNFEVGFTAKRSCPAGDAFYTLAITGPTPATTDDVTVKISVS